MKPLKAVVIGAGVGGLATAAALQAVGVEVEIYERGWQLRSDGAGLSLQSNGIRALRTLGLGIDGDIERRAGRLHGWFWKHPDGRPIRRISLDPIHEKLGAKSYFVHRGDLMHALHAGAGTLPIHFGAAAVGFVDDGDGVTVTFDDGSEARGDLLIGADGINSVVRAHLHAPQPVRPGEFVCWLACTPFDPERHPHVPRDGYGHLYWGRGMRFGIHDIGHGRVYWWGTRNAPAAVAANWHGTTEDLLEYFHDWAPETRELIASTELCDIVAVPAQDRLPIADWGAGRVTLLGDAAHPMLPSLGQGANCAIEDAVVLAHAVATVPNIGAALRVYEKRRAARTTRMVVDSRWLGQVEQTENRVLIAARDTYARIAPRSVLRHTMEGSMTFPGVSAPPAPLPRPLTDTERWHWVADQLSPLNAVAHVRIEGRVSRDDVAAALSVLQRCHPLLCAAVEAEDNGTHPWWVPVSDKPIPLRAITTADPGRWLTEINTRELVEPLDSTRGPLIRGLLVSSGPEQHDLILTSSYVVADPPAMLALLRHAVALASRHHRTGSVEINDALDFFAIDGPDALLPPSHRGIGGVHHGAASVLRDQRTRLLRRPVRAIPDADVEPSRRRTQLIHRQLGRQQARAMVQECDRRGVGVRSVLAAALLTAAGRAAEVAEGRPHAVGLGIGYRDQLDGAPSEWDLGAFQAMIEAVGTYASNGSPWELAAELERDSARRIALGDHLASVNIMSMMAPASVARSSAAVKAMQANGPGHLCLIHLDNTEFPLEYGDWQFRGAHVVSGISVSGLIIVTTTAGLDEMTIDVSYVPGMVSPGRAEFLADEMIRIVTDCVGPAQSSQSVNDIVRAV
ncbi:FAD-dependent monooxygenase [Nocardia sp. CA-128927]|uniref:FAD-dependent monooxygenase n=1 Tax=Nocardia sp. CA-128927 TaxID=3239975 RepID=UPI003D98EE07